MSASVIGAAPADPRIAQLEREVASLRAELRLAIEKSRAGWDAVALLERDILSSHRRSKKRSGYKSRPRKAVAP